MGQCGRSDPAAAFVSGMLNAGEHHPRRSHGLGQERRGPPAGATAGPRARRQRRRDRGPHGSGHRLHLRARGRGRLSRPRGRGPGRASRSARACWWRRAAARCSTRAPASGCAAVVASCIFGLPWTSNSPAPAAARSARCCMNPDPRGTLERLMEQRAALYEEVADVTVDTDGRKVGSVVEEILRRLDAGRERADAASDDRPRRAQLPDPDRSGTDRRRGRVRGRRRRARRAGRDQRGRGPAVPRSPAPLARRPQAWRACGCRTASSTRRSR